MRADMGGYISKFDVYQGRNTMQKDYNFPACFGLGEPVVAHFTSDLLQKNHVNFDNYFSSVPLMEYLKIRNVFACATIRSNRKYLPNNLTTEKVMNWGDFDYRVSAQEIVYIFQMDGQQACECNFKFSQYWTNNDTEEAKGWLSIRVPLPYSCERLQFLYGRSS